MIFFLGISQRKLVNLLNFFLIFPWKFGIKIMINSYMNTVKRYDQSIYTSLLKTCYFLAKVGSLRIKVMILVFLLRR